MQSLPPPSEPEKPDFLKRILESSGLTTIFVFLVLTGGLIAGLIVGWTVVQHPGSDSWTTIVLISSDGAHVEVTVPFPLASERSVRVAANVSGTSPFRADDHPWFRDQVSGLFNETPGANSSYAVLAVQGGQLRLSTNGTLIVTFHWTTRSLRDSLALLPAGGKVPQIAIDVAPAGAHPRLVIVSESFIRYGLGARTDSDYAITSSNGPILDWSLTASTHPRELAAATEPETVTDAVHLTWGDLFLYPD